jgi:hypothetical protein
VLDDPTRRGRIILGGDLNVSPLRWGPLHGVIFDRIELFGLESCLDYRERPTRDRRGGELAAADRARSGSGRSSLPLALWSFVIVRFQERRLTLPT